MNIHTDVPIKKFSGLKRSEPIPLNSSGLKEFQKCPRAYFFRYVLGYVPNEDKIWFAWGRAIHKFYEMAEVNLEKTQNINLSWALAIQAAITEWGNTKDAPPDQKKFAHMNKTNLNKVLTSAAKEWVKEKESGIIKVTQSEMPFVVQTDDGIWISGKIDQMISWSSRGMIRDFKSTSKKWGWYKREIFPSDQFKRYVYAARKLTNSSILGVAIDVIICNSEGLKFERDTYNHTSQELGDWEKSQVHWDKALKECRDNDEYPMVERSCNFCDYREVCTTRGEGSQLYTLKSKFHVDVWDNAK